MSVASLSLAAFVVAVLIVYHVLPHRFRVSWLLVDSYAFYATGLVELAGLGRSGVEVALVELPTLAGALPPEAGTRDLRQIFVERVSPVAAAEGMPFFQIDDGAAIPDDGWADLGHLNRHGAAAYSGWLGTRLAHAVRAGELSDPAR